MIATDRSRHLIVGGTILLAHAVAIYGLSMMAPGFRAVMADMPVNVRFLPEGPQPERWEPPKVKIVSTEINAPLPSAPVIESPSLPPSTHAISAPVATPEPVRTAPDDSGAPKLVDSVEYVREPAPRYPPQSRKLREQGLVVLRVLIDERGAACSIEVETSSGHARLDHAAQEAVARAEFRPYMEGGAPRRAVVLIPIEFSLRSGSA
ncbi:MAG TPA: energy transducer TonB [Povalibacter sp.]|nr:energy transducer TonB [Povalibacter sp.]